jgi:hypothetical protein
MSVLNFVVTSDSEPSALAIPAAGMDSVNGFTFDTVTVIWSAGSTVLTTVTVIPSVIMTSLDGFLRRLFSFGDLCLNSV